MGAEISSSSGAQDNSHAEVPSFLSFPPTVLEWLPLSLVSPCFSSVGFGLQTNNWPGSQETKKKKGPWERGLCGGNPKVAIDLRVGRSGQMLDACGLPGE